MTETSKNPWKGWTSYEESDLIPDENGKSRYSFVGREKEIDSLYTLICNYPLTTIYGRSGIGKTSVLQAGVFPLLRMSGFIPVICRFDGTTDCLDIIIKAVESACSCESLHESPSDNLVDFFLNSKFTKNGEEVTPVVILDQFEDLLKQGPEYYSTLLSQIHALVFDDFNTEIDINFRFVISIREDFLYLLEDAVDIAGYTEFKENRYRLLPMREESADKIINLGTNIPDQVRERLKALSMKDGNYSPALLSFYCHELYDACQGNISEASLPLLENESKIIERYYKGLFSKGGISRKSRRYIEENLQKNGMRSSVKQEAAEKNIPEFKKLIANDSHKLLQTFRAGDDTHVELIHDKVAEIIQENRNATDNRRWRIMFRALASLLSIILIFTSVYFYINDIYAEDNLTSSTQTANIDSDFESPFVRTLIIPDKPDFINTPLDFNQSKYSKLRKIIISEGCDSIQLTWIPDYTTIEIPASVSYLTINKRAEHLSFEVDENNPWIKLYDGALWRVYPEYDKCDDLIWASSDKKYISFPPDKYNGSSTKSFHEIYYNHQSYFNRNHFIGSYCIKDTSRYHNGAAIELSNKDKTVDLSNDSTLRGKVITRISNLEYVETLILPRGSSTRAEAIINAPKLKKVIVSDSVTLSGKSFMYCPNLSRVELASTVKFVKGNVPVFQMCPPIDFKIAEGSPFSFSKGVLKSSEFPYLIHSNINELQPELFSEEIEAGKMSYDNGWLIAFEGQESTGFYNWEKWSWVTDGHLISFLSDLPIMRPDLVGITDIHLCKSFSSVKIEKLISSINYIPKEVRKKITLHIPYGTSMEFLNIPEASYFKDVVEDSFDETGKNVFRMQVVSMTRAWRDNTLIVVSAVLGFILLIMMIPAIRRNIKNYLLYIPAWLLLFYGLYWTIFNLTPPRWVSITYVQLAEAISSGAISLIVTLWLVNCNRHSFDPLKKIYNHARQYLEKKAESAKASLFSFLNSLATGRCRRIYLTILIIIGVVGVVYGIISEVRLHIDRKLDECATLIRKDDYDSAVESLPMPNIFYSSRQTAVLDSLTDILTEGIQPLAPFSTIEESWEPDGMRYHALSPDNRLFAASDNSCHVVIYDLNSKKPTMAFDIPFSGYNCRLDFNEDGSKLLLNSNGRLFIADTDTKTVSHLKNIPHSYRDATVFTNDSTILGKYGFTLCLYNLRTGEETQGPDISIYDWALSPSRETVAALTGNHKFMFLDSKDLSVISSFTSPEGIHDGLIRFNETSDTIVVKRYGTGPSYTIPLDNPGEITMSENAGHDLHSWSDMDNIIETLKIPMSYYEYFRIAEFDGKVYKQPSHISGFWEGVFSDDSIGIAQRPFRNYDILPNPDYYLPNSRENSLPKGSVYNIKTETFLQLDSLRTIMDISPSGQKVLYSNEREDTVYLEDIHGKEYYTIPMKHNRHGCGFMGSDNRLAISGNNSIVTYLDTIRIDAIPGRAVCFDSNGHYLLAYVKDIREKREKWTTGEEILAVLDAETLKPLIYCGHGYDNALFTSSGELLLTKCRRIHRYTIPATLSDRIRFLKERSEIKVYTPGATQE